MLKLLSFYFILLLTPFYSHSIPQDLLDKFNITTLQDGRSEACFLKKSNVHLNYDAHVIKKNGDLKLVDSTKNHDEDFIYDLTKSSNRIRCFDLMIEKMCEGDKVGIWSEPEYAFGKMGIPGMIPGNSKMYFELETVKFLDDRKKNDL